MISSSSAGSYSIVAIYLFRDPTVETLLDIEGDAADLDRERLILRRGEEAFAIQVDLVELVLGALQVFAGFQDLGRQVELVARLAEVPLHRCVDLRTPRFEIGRASGRERVCQYG